MRYEELLMELTREVAQTLKTEYGRNIDIADLRNWLRSVAITKKDDADKLARRYLEATELGY